MEVSQCLNKALLSPTIGRRTCNWINIPQCPLQQKCLSNNILYQANITPIGENSETKVYYGICGTTFKIRYANHKKSFNHRNRWKIKDNKRSANITWEILGRHQAYNTSSKRCSLCLNEKLKIALHRNNNMLNRRTEISGWFLFSGSSPDYQKHRFPVKSFRETFNVASYYVEDTTVL